MSQSTLEQAEFTTQPQPQGMDRFSVEGDPSSPLEFSAARKMARSAMVWLLYVPHLALLKLLGPRLGPMWARGLSRLHWLLTLFGAQRSTRRILNELRPQFERNLSVSAILRKHLELKHECFARFKLFNGRGEGNNPGELTWEVDPKMAARFNRAKSSKRGLIIVGYHFGFFRLSLSRLPHIFPSCDAVYVSYRRAHYAGATMNAVAEMALKKALQADQTSWARIHYLEPESSVARIYRMLLAGETVALAADGIFAKDFVEVPFMGAKLRLPSGWARLAAATGSQVLILIDTEIDNRRRRVWVFDHVQVPDTSAPSVYGAVAEAARILERFVRREPWAWHPWQRLHLDSSNGDSRLLMLTALGQNPGTRDQTGYRSKATLSEKSPSDDDIAVSRGVLRTQ